MGARTKLVAFVLALVILAGPAAALAACWSPAGAHHCCMNSKGPTARSFAPKPCCEISSSRTAPASAIQAPDASATVVPPPTALAVMDLPSRAAAELPTALPFPPAAPSQSVLCVFLV